MDARPEVLVRPARRGDAPALGRFGAALVRHHHALDPARFLQGEHMEMENGYASFLAGELSRPRSVVLVAERRVPEGGALEPVGYAYGRLEGRDWMALLDAAGKLHDVYVDPSARRLGAGRMLVTEVIQRLVAMGAPRVVLSTAYRNAEAQALFASLGFRPTMLEMTRDGSG